MAESARRVGSHLRPQDVDPSQYEALFAAQQVDRRDASPRQQVKPGKEPTRKQLRYEWGCSQCGKPIKHFHLHSLREVGRSAYAVCDACTDELRTINGFRPLGEYDYTANYVQQPIPPDVLEARCAKYRITPDRFLAMVADQQERCAICRHRPPRVEEFVIDHNHKTGKVRGLLCGKCNTALGMFRDSPDVLDAAIDYLERNGCYGLDSLAEEAP